MLFRKVSARQYEFLLDWVSQTDTPYETKTYGRVMFFGLSAYHWRKLEYAGTPSPAVA